MWNNTIVKTLSIFISRICIIAAILALLSSCGPRLFREQRLSISKDSSIPVSITVISEIVPDWEGIFGFIKSKADMLDFRNENGALYKLNKEHAAILNDELIHVLKTSIEYAGLTGGAFDPTILPLSSLWAINTRTEPPDPGEIASAKNLVDYTKIKIGEAGSVSLQPGFGIDLGGIAQGAIVDSCARFLEASGYRDFLIDISGDIIVSGIKPHNVMWVIGIEHPRERGKLIKKVRLGEKNRSFSIVTSGDYEQFFMAGSRRYHHILDPRTGYPAEEVISATIISERCMDADALSTAAIVLGFERGLSLIENLPNTEGLMVRENDGYIEETMTSGFGKHLVMD